MTSLNESLVSRQIDVPVDKAAESYSHQKNLPLDHKRMHKIMSDFVHHIYTTGLRSDWIISDPLAETLLLLDRYYQGRTSDGYTGAMIDAADNKIGGINLVLAQLKEIIKTIERAKYIKAVFSSSIDNSDWYLKCEIARMLFEKYKNILPPELLSCSPEQMADEIDSLLILIQNSFTTLQQIADSSEKNQDNWN